jgi:hypothetical protein
MCLINDIFRKYFDKFFIFFFDDILIYLEEHERHFRMVLYVLRDNKFYSKMRECSFYQNQIHYLAHIIS